MTAPESGEDRARDFREVAQERLRQIRAERAANPRTILVHARLPVSEGGTDRQADPSLWRAAPDSTRAGSAPMADRSDPAPAGNEPEFAVSRPGDIADDGAKHPEMPGTGEQVAAAARTAGTGLAASATREPHDGAPDSDASAARGGPEDTDLHQLPGAGEGLVWLLQQKGIQSLAELARTDAAQLATRLELVGKLIDLDAWIVFARERSGT